MVLLKISRPGKEENYDLHWQFRLMKIFAALWRQGTNDPRPGPGVLHFPGSFAPTPSSFLKMGTGHPRRREKQKAMASGVTMVL